MGEPVLFLVQKSFVIMKLNYRKLGYKHFTAPVINLAWLFCLNFKAFSINFGLNSQLARAQTAFSFIHFDGHQHGIELLFGIASFDQDYRVEGQKYAVENHKAIKHIQERHEA